MKRDAAVAILQAHADELKKLGVVSVSLFGSTARDEAADNSDIDMAVRLAPGPRGSPRSERMEHLRAVFAELLGCPVGVVEEPTSRRRIQQEIERDRQLASGRSSTSTGGSIRIAGPRLAEVVRHADEAS